MNKAWHAYAKHVLDAIAKIHRISHRGNIATDEVLYDAALRNLQTLSEATQMLPLETCMSALLANHSDFT
jgi:uncharacterized protein with HEPN domain